MAKLDKTNYAKDGTALDKEYSDASAALRGYAESQVNSSAGWRATKSPAFHKLSSEFLGGETSRDYVAELLFFILITGIAAWPVVSMLIAVTRLIRNY